jgi:hypothetical protein
MSSVGVIMAMLRHLSAKTKYFVCVNSHRTRCYSASEKTMNDIPAPQGVWPLIGHAHLFLPMGLCLSYIISFFYTGIG